LTRFEDFARLSHGAGEVAHTITCCAEEEEVLMRPWNVRGAVGVIALLMLVGCASMSSRESTGDSSEDAAITTKVRSSFVADPLVSTSAINVETRRGIVYLTGFVKSEQARQRAIQLAQGVAGVREIIVRDLVVQR
jgi:osmotically-inducible protein OsmY